MPDIITPSTTVEKTIKTRAPYIGITNPESPSSDPFLGKTIDFNCAHVLRLDGKTVSTVNSDDEGKPLRSNIKRNVADVYTQTQTITDPVTGQSVTLSVAGLALVIETLFAQWYGEDTTPK